MKSSDTIDKADVDISPGGGTMKRQIQAMMTPTEKEAMAILPWSCVRLELLLLFFVSMLMSFYITKIQLQQESR